MTDSWLPRFACPACEAEVARTAVDELTCAACGRRFRRRDGIWRCLLDDHAAALAPVLHQYRAVRQAEGYRVGDARYYRRLPYVRHDDPHAVEWQVRRETFEHLRDLVLPRPETLSIHVLDVGAGCGWLSHRLATHGHDVVALDWLDDDQDGLGACRHYDASIVAVQGDVDRAPLVPAQFDVVVFNASLHYSADVAATLARARRLLAPGGALVVMDSPMFAHARDGVKMVNEKLQRFASEYGLVDGVHPGVGFLTFESLAGAAGSVNLRHEFVPTRGPLGWRLRRSCARLRLGRAPAAFGLWVAR